MKFTAAVSALLYVEVALGAKFTEKRRENRASRQLSRRGGDTVIRKSQPLVKASYEGSVTNNSFVQYSTNWAGAVISSTGFTEVTGTVVVPTLTTSSANTAESAGAAVSLFCGRRNGHKRYTTEQGCAQRLIDCVPCSGSALTVTLAKLPSSRLASTDMLRARV